MADTDDDVQYDNAAFGYFLLTGLFLYIVPSAIYTLVRLVGALRGGSDDDVRCHAAVACFLSAALLGAVVVAWSALVACGGSAVNML